MFLHLTAIKLKTIYQKKYQGKLEKSYKEKKVQLKIWNDITEGGRSLDNFKWIKTNMALEKVGQIIRIQEQIIPKRTFLQMQGKHQKTTTCRLCEMYPESTLHWMSACPYLAGFEYLKRQPITYGVLCSIGQTDRPN